MQGNICENACIQGVKGIFLHLFLCKMNTTTKKVVDLNQKPLKTKWELIYKIFRDDHQRDNLVKKQSSHKHLHPVQDTRS